MKAPRLKEIRIEGMRSLDRIVLPLEGLTVLIGENGSGKSTIVEACELLACAARPNFLEAFNQIHGGVSSLLRADRDRVVLGARIDKDGSDLGYEISVARQGVYTVIEKEEAWVEAGSTRRNVLFRDTSDARFWRPIKGTMKSEVPPAPTPIGVNPAQTALSMFGAQPAGVPTLALIANRLDAIRVHLPFDTLPYWASRERKRASDMRDPAVLEPASQLARYGTNIANAFHSLKNDFSGDAWRETLEHVRLGLGEDVEDVGTRADAGGGRHALTLQYRGQPPIPAIALSDGVLAFLAHVVLIRLSGNASLVAFDEPELHLHPALLMRVLGFFESMAQERPVILATHSDRLLDGLQQPEQSAVLCELDETRATKLLRPDAQKLRCWLDKFTMSEMRSGGHERTLFVAERPD